MIFTQANQEKAESPITFFSSNLQVVELNYSDVECRALERYVLANNLAELTKQQNN